MDEFTIDEGYVAGLIPPREARSHKGMNGRVCIVGGSRVYHGAPFLSAMAALRTGVDLVYLAVPNIIASPIRALSPDLIVIPLPDAKLTRGNVAKLKGWVPQVDTVGIGPGLGFQREHDVENAITQLREMCKTMVVDADALRPVILKGQSGTVVTPHAGEFERLFRLKLGDDLRERVEQVSRCAGENNLTVLLKGQTDVISDGKLVGLNTTHTPAMTVGGTGDVLTGVASAMLAKGLAPFEAACCAAFLNGVAGMKAVEEHGLHITASDVVRHLPSAMRKFDRVK